MELPRYKGIESIPIIVLWFLENDDKIHRDLLNVEGIKEKLINWNVMLFQGDNQFQIKEALNVLFHEFTYIIIPQLEDLKSKLKLNDEQIDQYKYLQLRLKFLNSQLRISGWIYREQYGVGFEPYGNPNVVLGFFEGFVDHYAILEVYPSASSEDIKKAFRAKAKIHHPDVGGNEESFKAIKDAFDILMDDEKRREFNHIYEIFQKRNDYVITSSNNDYNQFVDQPNHQFRIGFKWKSYLRNLGILIALLLVIKFITILNISTSSAPTTNSLGSQSYTATPVESISKKQQINKSLENTTPKAVLSPIKDIEKDKQPQNIENKENESIKRFSLEANKDEVKEIMGTPVKITDIGPLSTWYYGNSTVDFNNDKVTGWNNRDKNLKLEQVSIKNGTYSLGSTKEDVRIFMGTPSEIMTIGPLSTWYYGNSTVDFNNGKVTGWNNRDKNLKLEQVTIKNGTISLGSSKDDVKLYMGTPSRIMTIGPLSTWYYVNSTVEFNNGKVTGWNNRDKNLTIN
ncbi:DnaJ domain-containing protein [Paenibacillus sp. LjRoot153]|uniref:DnaJ domain-containing protein n=1 Tax=Paenibacillus sp. LjRoot153 TaxID=3342270 RepID=UPI003ECFF5F2